MVTYSKIECGMGQLCFPRMRLGYHYKTFTSKNQYTMVLNSLHRLQESGFYYNTATGKEANVLLAEEPNGTFLVRDSSDQHHLFTLSVKTMSGTRNVRIQCDDNTFYLHTDPKHVDSVPHFDCVLKLINHYMPQGTGTIVTYIYSKGERTPLELIRPLYCSTSSLKHLCRKQINRDVGVSSGRNQLPTALQQYLIEYDESF